MHKHFFPHILEVSSIYSIEFYDSRLNFSKVTSTWGILVFMTIPSQKEKALLHTPQLLQWERDKKKILGKTEVRKILHISLGLYFIVRAVIS